MHEISLWYHNVNSNLKFGMLNYKVPFLFIFFLSILILTAEAQLSHVRRHNVFKIDIAGPLFLHEYGFAFEHVLNVNISGQLGIQIFEEGYSVIPALKYYPLKTAAPEGLFAAPYGKVVISNMGGKPGYGFGMLVGYQFLLAERVTTELFAGPDYTHYSEDIGWDIWGGLTFGIAF